MSLLKEIFDGFNMSMFEKRGNISFVVEEFRVSETRKLAFLACTVDVTLPFQTTKRGCKARHEEHP
jgi:hypothetical protein